MVGMNFATFAFPFSIEKIEFSNGEGLLRITFLCFHLDIYKVCIQ